jgi:hypothetical protein
VVAIDYYNTDNPHVHLVRSGRPRPVHAHPSGLPEAGDPPAQPGPGDPGALGYRSERRIVQAREQSIERLHFTDSTGRSYATREREGW